LELSRQWGNIVDGEGAEQSEPAFLRREVLWVSVTQSVWMQQLQTMKPQLLEKIQQVLPQAGITDIRWQLRPLPPKRPKKEVGRPVAGVISEEEQAAMRDQVATIQDSACREALLQLWRRHRQ
jgi:hypothetical protein